MQHLSQPDYGISYREGNPLEWMHEGVCEQVDPDLFFEDEASRATVNARLLCETCPVLSTCRDYALRQPNLYGVWGNTTRSERMIIRRVWLTASELESLETAEAEEALALNDSPDLVAA